VRKIDTSIQYGIQRATSAINQFDGQINRVISSLTKLQTIMSQIGKISGGMGGAGGAGGGKGGAAGGGGGGFDLNGYLSQLLTKGFNATGRDSASVTGAGVKTAIEYANALNRKLTAQLQYTGRSEPYSDRFATDPAAGKPGQRRT